ncbi:MAG: type II secretion system protein [bacterium]|nr:type II secretion system protein [bacterium]
MRKAFTLIEFLVVLIIIGIAASVALPNFSGRLEQFRAQESEATLLLINNAQKRYKMVNGRYFTCAPNCDVQSINENLTLDIQGDYYFNYSIAAWGSSNEGFQATATRKDGTCADKHMSSTYLNNTISKECAQW